MLFFPSLAPLGTAVEMSLLSAALYLTLLGIDCVTSARQLHFSVTVFAVTLSVRGEGVQTQLPLCLQTIYMCNYGSVLVITCLWSITHPVISFLPQASETHTWRHTHTHILQQCSLDLKTALLLKFRCKSLSQMYTGILFLQGYMDRSIYLDRRLLEPQ